MCRPLSPLLVAACLLAGCADDAAPRRDASIPEPPGLPGAYAGELPCSNCAAIAATLWLRDDGRFVLRQLYLGAEQRAEGAAAYALGVWRWDETAGELVLDGAGPDRRLAPDGERLELLTPSPLAHVLEREAVPPPFTDRLQLDGMSTIADGGASFAECLTGLSFPVANAAGFGELRRLHRRLSKRGAAAHTTVEAHFAPALALHGGEPETLVIDRVLQMSPSESC